MDEQGFTEGENKEGTRKKTVPSDLAFRTTLSTSTSSFEALDPHDPQLNRLASVAFSGIFCRFFNVSGIYRITLFALLLPTLIFKKTFLF